VGDEQDVCLHVLEGGIVEPDPGLGRVGNGERVDEEAAPIVEGERRVPEPPDPQAGHAATRASSSSSSIAIAQRLGTTVGPYDSGSAAINDRG